MIPCVSAADRLNKDGDQMEFKSKQWFGASVRSDGEHILVTQTNYFIILLIIYESKMSLTDEFDCSPLHLSINQINNDHFKILNSLIN